MGHVRWERVHPGREGKWDSFCLETHCNAFSSELSELGKKTGFHLSLRRAHAAFVRDARSCCKLQLTRDRVGFFLFLFYVSS